jgi:site-specific recombinase XerC
MAHGLADSRRGAAFGWSAFACAQDIDFSPNEIRVCDGRGAQGRIAIRPSFATHLREGGCDSRTAQELPGHKDAKTTMSFTLHG